MSHVFAGLMTPMVDRPNVARECVHREKVENQWGLSAIECRVMDVMLETGRNVIVAERLGLSAKTVDCHVANIVRKMGVENRILAILAWYRFRRAGLGARV